MIERIGSALARLADTAAPDTLVAERTRSALAGLTDWPSADGGVGIGGVGVYVCVMHLHRRLDVYGESLDLAEDAYGLARALPEFERFELSSQIRRASTSIAVNIAEGAGRGGDKEFARFVRIAIGSACEIEALMDLVSRLHPAHSALADSLQRSVQPLIARLRRLERHLTP